MRFTGFVLAAATAGSVSVSASPVSIEPREGKTVAVPLKHVSNARSIKSLTSQGQARLNHYNNKGRGVVSSAPITNELVSYVAPVDIGGTTYSLIVDTGCM
jgi:hypothetical protein